MLGMAIEWLQRSSVILAECHPVGTASARYTGTLLMPTLATVIRKLGVLVLGGRITSEPHIHHHVAYFAELHCCVCNTHRSFYFNLPSEPLFPRATLYGDGIPGIGMMKRGAKYLAAIRSCSAFLASSLFLSSASFRSSKYFSTVFESRPAKKNIVHSGYIFLASSFPNR